MAISAQQYYNQVKTERDTKFKAKKDELRPTGLTGASLIYEAQQDPEIAALDKELVLANALTSVSTSEDPVTGTNRYWVGNRQYRYQEYSQLLSSRGINVPPDRQATTQPAAEPALASPNDSESVKVAVVEDENEVVTEAVAAQQAAEVVNQEKVAARAEAQRQRVEFDEDDWRVRLHVAPEADYLYKADKPGILAPLVETDGIIFPYTPEIQVQYNANYENYDLVHSNYRGYFYTGSQVENIIVTAIFTANDLKEANYMLASMHFLRSATKMFYGQDLQRGMPPPLVFLTGLGEYQFNGHPCAITMMNYNLPTDVDFIPCGVATGVNNNAPLPRPNEGFPSSSLARLQATNVGAGGARNRNTQTGDNRSDTAGPNVTYSKATYVPTKIEINFTMIPVQTREQVSERFSLQDYASGLLLKKGFW